MTEERSAERLIVFVDAVVAIAITLLVLPLAEVPRHDDGSTLHSFGTQLSLDISPLIGFVVSFFVIARFWWAHHQTFATVRRWSWPLVQLNVLWLFTVVLLPAVTAISFEYDPRENPLSVGLYIATMLVSSLLLTALSVIVHRDRAVAPDAGNAASRNRIIGGAAASVAFALALVIGTTFPVINYWALWLVALTGPFEFLVRRAYRRREPALARLSDPDARMAPSPELPSRTPAEQPAGE
ncbi:MAG TPA: TMEM175 family protein [Amnibacterium sp.]|uniref:TMEM175 family protein n=1 Tax=Amnibacterium sp. TaxID=1872496 RepID=UPI002F94DB02